MHRRRSTWRNKSEKTITCWADKKSTKQERGKSQNNNHNFQPWEANLSNEGLTMYRDQQKKKSLKLIKNTSSTLCPKQLLHESCFFTALFTLFFFFLNQGKFNSAWFQKISAPHQLLFYQWKFSFLFIKEHIELNVGFFSFH